jgi:hypothetical protein
MTIAEELTDIAKAIGALEGKFVKSDSLYGHFLPSEEEAKFKRLIVEAKTLMDDALGLGNDFAFNLVHTANTMRGGMTGSISLAGVRAARELVEAGAARAAKKAAMPPASVSSAPIKTQYVNSSRIAELRSVRGKFDTTRLTRLCEELNLANEHDCHMSKAMIVRAIADHVPPVFGCANFNEVANNYAGSKSFRGSMQHLQNSLRHIADGALHVQIRATEVLPTPQQVDYRQDLDALLAEVVRLSK